MSLQDARWSPLSRLPDGGRSTASRNVIDLLQVDHGGEGVELLEHVVRSAILDQLRDRPVGIRGVTEHDRAGWACGGARRGELVRLHVPMLERGAILGLAN